MKLLKIGLIAMLMSSGIAQAIDPMPGWYGGIKVGGSRTPDTRFNLDLNTPIGALISPSTDGLVEGVLTYTLLGNVGGQVGYRFHHTRVEGEFFYNNNPFSHLTIGSVNIPNNASNMQGIGNFNPFTFQGYTSTYALMLNGLYDFYLPQYTEHAVPYVGLGLGYAYVEHNLDFLLNGSTFSLGSISQFTNNVAAQGIVGLSYFLTDYTSFSLDIRYFSGLKQNQQPFFNERPQLYMVNLLFNASFNLA